MPIQTQVVPALGIQNLQMSIVAKGYGDKLPVLCTMYVYDLTPESTSYTCFEVRKMAPLEDQEDGGAHPCASLIAAPSLFFLLLISTT